MQHSHKNQYSATRMFSFTLGWMQYELGKTTRLTALQECRYRSDYFRRDFMNLSIFNKSNTTLTKPVLLSVLDSIRKHSLFRRWYVLKICLHTLHCTKINVYIFELFFLIRKCIETLFCFSLFQKSSSQRHLNSPVSSFTASQIQNPMSRIQSRKQHLES